MIIPFESPNGFKSELLPAREGEAYWFIFSGDQLLVESDTKRLPQDHSFLLQSTLYLGTLGETHLFAGTVKEQPAPVGWTWLHLRHLHPFLDAEHYALAGRALQLLNWDLAHQFCGRCGMSTFPRQNERCRECTACGQLSYPNMAPVIMALVQRGDKILLARGPHFPEKMYSVIAGFVDPGETLEQCVVREVQEEVGIRVKNIRYFGSQPWPFSNSLMVAFLCDWEEGEIVMDNVEIEAAGWFDRADLPQLPPTFSLARLLIDSWS